MIRRPPRSTLDRSSAASDVYKRQLWDCVLSKVPGKPVLVEETGVMFYETLDGRAWRLSLIHISEPTRPY